MVIVLVVLLMISLMGTAIITIAQTELMVANNANHARKARLNADAAANISFELIQAVLKSKYAENHEFGGGPSMAVETNHLAPEKFAATEMYPMRSRYQLLGSRNSSEDIPVPAVIIKDRAADRVVARALIFNDYSAAAQLRQEYGAGYIPGAAATVADGGNSVSDVAYERYFNVITIGYPQNQANEKEESFGLGCVISVIYRAVP